MQHSKVAHRSPGRRLAVLLGSTASVALLLTGSTARATTPVECAEIHFQVALAEGGPADQDLVGWLCSRGGIEHKTIQVLLHGASYDHTYWDFPLEPERYSYVRWATAAGYATLSLDRLGSGMSSHPDSTALTLHAGAHAVHQVVQSLRHDAIAVPGLGVIGGERVMLVGHSLGSFIASIESSTYDDVDGVILSGYSHTPGPGSVTLQTSVYPAMFDPKFTSSGFDPGYFTTLPGTRGANFYYAGNADPAVIAMDEELKQTATLGELLDIAPSFPATLGMTVPTLVVAGDFDTIDCLPPSCSASHSLDGEEYNYGNPSCVEVVTMPSSGHNLNLHRNAPLWYGIAALWSGLFVGADTTCQAPLSCPP